jgi:hypothetical protein
MISDHLVTDASDPYLTHIITAKVVPGSTGSWSCYGQRYVRRYGHPIYHNKETEGMYTEDRCIACYKVCCSFVATLRSRFKYPRHQICTRTRAGSSCRRKRLQISVTKR